MSCISNTEKYTNLVSKFLKIDPVKFSDFDNVAEFILSNPLKDNSKTNTLHHLAVIYSQLQDATNGEIKKGKAEQIKGLVSFIGVDDKVYLDTVVKDIYPSVKPVTVSKKEIIKLLNDLNKYEELDTLNEDLPRLFGLINNYFNFNKFKDSAAKEKDATEFLTLYSNIVQNNPNELALTSLYKNKVKNYFSDSNYIALNSIELPLELQDTIFDRVLLQMNDGTYIDAYRMNNIFYDAITNAEVDTKNVMSKKELLNIPLANKFVESQEIVVFEPFLQSGINIKDIDADVKLSTVSDPLTQVKITAVPLPFSTDDRIDVYSEIANADSTYDNLKNRQHETFENVQQVNYLEKNKDGVVATLYSPKKSENQFTLIGEYNGKRFVIYTLDNYAFLNADNKTSKIDFSNKNHLDLVAKTFKKKSGSSIKNEELTANDIMQLKSVYETYTQLKNDILNTPGAVEAFEEGQSVDVSDLFHSYYNVNSYESKQKDYTNLLDVLESDNKGLYLPLEIATVTEDGNITEVNVKNIPFIALRRVDLNYFYLYNPLSNNERVYYNGKAVSLELYTEQVLLKGELFDTYAKRILTPQDQNQQSMILTFKEDALSSVYKPLNVNVKTNNVLRTFVDFLTTLNTVLQSTDRSKMLRRFGVDYFQILNRNSELSKNAVLNFNFSNDANNNLVLEIRPYTTNNRYNLILANKGKFNIRLPETKIKNIYSKLAAENFEVDAVNEAIESFNDMFEETVLSALANPENIDENFAKLFREDYTLNGNFVPQFIFFDYDLNNKRSFFKIYKAKNNRQQLPNLKFSINDFEIVDTFNNRKSIIAPKTSNEIVSLPVNTTIQKIVEETAKTETKQEDAKGTNLPGPIEFDEEVPFKLLDQDYSPISNEEFESELAWLQNTYSKFGLSLLDLEDIMALTKLNTDVLGFIKNKVIYLNTTLKSKGVVYHEAFHGVFQYLMNEAERQKLLNSIISNPEYAQYFTDEFINSFAEERNYAYNKQELINRVAEEILANRFQQFMIDRKAPTSLIEKFFNLLEKVINYFRANKDVIETTFEKIAAGKYATRSMQELANNDSISYLTVPGLNIIYKDYDTSKIKAKASVLGSNELNQLTNMLVYSIISNEENTKLSFNEKFDIATKTLLDTVYNLDVLTSQTDNEQIKQSLIEEFSDLYNQYRFVLGARLKGLSVFDINHTGSVDYSTQVLKNEYKDALLNKSEPNGLGEYSYETLKKIVESKYKTLNSLLSEKDIDGSSISGEEVEALIENEEGTTVKDPTDFSSDEIDSDETESFDNFVEKNALDSIPRQIKRFLAINTYNLEHPVHKDIFIPRVINGVEIFSTLLQISSDLAHDKIIEQMETASKTMIEDGNYEIGNDLKITYENLKRFTGITDDNNKPVRNKQLYNMFIEALHVTSLQYSLFTTEIEKVQENPDDVNSPIINRVKYISVKDKVLYEDINQKKKDIVDQFLVAYNKNNRQDNYQQAITNLLNAITTIKTKSHLLESLNADDSVLINMTNAIHDNLKEIGFNIPKSLVRLSLIGIDTLENNQPVTLYDSYIKEHYDINKDFINSDKYLNKKFFNDLYSILSRRPNPETLSNSFDDSSKEFGGFNSILRRASEYIIKYDPSALPSVVRNAEGKLIYRYVKYTPLLWMVKQYNKNGFLTVKDDADYERFLKDFYKSHPTLSLLLLEKDEVAKLTPEELAQYKKMDTFIRNMNVSLYGGAQLIEQGKVLNAASYYNLEKTSSHLLALFSFLKREKIYIDDSYIETYNRQHAQNETSPTNFLISGMYEQFATAAGPTLVNGRLKIVETFQSVIKQEYDRIKKEWSEKDNHKTKFLNKEANYLREGYNAEKKNGEIIVDNKNFKAYNFSKLPKFFNNFTDIKDLLKDNAFAGNTFESLSEVVLDNGQNLMDYLLDALNDYAVEQYQYHLDLYVASGIINKKEVAELATPFQDPATRKLIPKLRGGRKTISNIYTSDYFNADTKIISSFEQFNFGDVYGSYNTPLKKYATLNDKQEPVSIVKSVNIENFLIDHVFNHMHNSLLYNQLFDGDESLIAKDDVDLVKRNKRFLISGNNFKNGYFKSAYIEKLKTFLHPQYAKYGHYNTVDEIINDPRLDDSTRVILEDSFNKGEHRHELADGQSWSTILHQIDQFETMGKLSDESLKILIAKNYRDITEAEFKTLQKDRIVLNPKKTATGSRTIYLKLSETYIDRNDVSYIPIPDDIEEENKLEYLQGIYDELQDLYGQAYSLRKQIQNMWTNKEYSGIDELENNIQDIFKQIHDYYLPKPGRKDLHVMLNSMEYYNIDMIMDNNASKNSKVFPSEFFTAINDSTDKLDLRISSIKISNEYKYNQVETSRMKDESKVSIQRKVLLPADIRHLQETLGRKFEKEELKNYNHILSVLDNYNAALKESADAGYNNLVTFLRDENGNYDLGKIYDIIRENLDLQGTPDSIKDLFVTDSTGNIIINPNIPAIREIIQYYFFSLYSKATDEKSSGKKYILASSYGYDLVVDENDNVVPESEIEKNPTAYESYRKRPLSVTTEIDDNGFTRYYIEVLVPKPYFSNAQDELFYLDNLNKFFATRIPTEDKRSMAIFKAVGFINSAHGNAIIVPQIVHYLSGSDLDIDTVYTQMYNYYTNFNNEKVVFGDYSSYNNENEGQFIEYLLYNLKDSDLNTLVKNKVDEVLDTENYKYSSAAKKIAKMLGYNDQQIDIVESTKSESLFAVVNMMKEDRDTIFEQIDNIKKSNNFEILKAEAKNKNKNARKKLNEIYELTNPLYERVNQILRGKEIAYSTFELYGILAKLEGIVKVYSKNNLPTSITAFNKNLKYKNGIRPIAQNKLLSATEELLSNQLMFDNLYINQKSSTESFDAVLNNQGVDIKNISQNFPYDHHSIAGVINSKSMSQSDKANVGRSANMNKTAAFINENTPTDKPNIKFEDVAFRFLQPVLNKETNEITYELVSYNKYGIADYTLQRVIKKIGDSIGMFTDAGKEPKPALLGINDANSNFVLSSLALGINDNLIFNLIRIPEFVNATQEVLNSERTVNINPAGKVTIDAALSKQLKNLKDNNSEAFDKLKAAGIIPVNTSITTNNFTINKSNVIIEFTPMTLDFNKILNNTLSLSDLGITVSALKKETKNVAKNKKVTTEVESVEVIPLSEAEQKIILLHYIREQNRQAFQLSQVSSLVNTLKSLKPDMKSIDFMYNNIKMLKENMLFLTDDVVNSIFSKNKVWNTQLAILDDFMSQASLLFLERSNYFKGLTNLFNSSFKDKSVIASTLTSYLALYKFKKEYPGSRKGINDAQNELIELDDNILKETFTASYWFTHGLDIELKQLKEKYPNNKFLQYLRPFTTKNFAVTSDGRKFYEKYIGLITKSKIKGDLAKEISDDAKVLSSVESAFMNKLFYHEIARTSLQTKEHSFLKFLDPVYLKAISKYMNVFTEKLKDKDVDFKKTIKEFINPKDEAELFQVLNEMFDVIANTSYNQIENYSKPIFYNFEKHSDASYVTKKIEETDEVKKNMIIGQELTLYLNNVVIGSSEDTFVKNIDKRNSIIFNDRNQFIKFDFDHESDDVKGTFKNVIARKFNIKFDAYNLEYVYPAIIKINNSLYVLQKAYDNETEAVAKSKSLGETFMQDTGYISNIGNTAVYKKLGSSIVNFQTTLNPGSLSKEELIKYSDYIKTSRLRTNNMLYLDVVEEVQEQRQTENVQFKETEIKPGVEELFDSNPELANQVYKALGFDSDEFSLVLKEEEENAEGIMLGKYDIIHKNNVIGNVFLPIGYKNYTIKGISFKEQYLNKGLGKAFYKWLGNKADTENATLNSDFDNTSESAERVWESLKKENLAENVQMGFRFKSKNLKQQALQLYSQYLKTGKQDVEGFKNFVATQPSIQPTVTKPTVSTSTEQPTVTNNPADFTNHSGGAYGGDTFWDTIGREFGVTNHKHYKDAGNANLSQKLRNAGVKAEILTKEQMNKARTEIEKLLGEKYPDTLQGNLQVRNYYQVANADAVFAVAKLDTNKNFKSTAVFGGTNTAVQLGIKLNKPVYVWDIFTEKWHKYDTSLNQFEVTNTPKLTRNFAGVGSRDIENYNVQDKVTKQWKPRKEYIGIEKEQKAKQAIRDVYANTFKNIQPTTQPTEAATNFKIGQYVSYNKNGDVYIVTKALEGNKYQIYNPNKEGAAAKLQVSADNILPYKALFAKIVEYNPGENYIVTSAGTIISLTSNKKMNFLPNDGRRVKILALASGATSTSAMSYETMTPEDQWLQYGNKLIEKYGPGIKDVWTEKDQDFRNHKIKCL